MHIQFLWNIIQDTYIFIILAWLITTILLKQHRYYKLYLTVSAVVYILILLYVTLLGRTASTEYKIELSFLWEYRLALSGNNAWWIQIFDNIMLFVPMGWLWGGLRDYHPPKGDWPRCGPSLCSPSQGKIKNRVENGIVKSNEKDGIRKSQWLKAIIFALCVSSAIELCQLVFKLGLFEFDDILNNTVGMIVGYGVYVIWGRTGSTGN